MKIAFKTFGCRLNISETESIIGQFVDRNIITSNIDDADIVVINSCTVTAEAEKKCLRLISKILNEKKICIVTGCFDPSKSIQDSKLFYIPLDYKGSIYNFIQNLSKNNYEDTKKIQLNLKSSNFLNNKFFIDYNILIKNRFLNSKFDKRFHSRAFLKIQDGCNNNCSYCKVRIVRGNVQSLPIVNILNNLDIINDLGFKEVVLTGINIASYRDENVNFSSLLEKLINKYPDFIFQLSSIEINNLDDKFFDIIKLENIKPYFHLPLQSGSNKILKLMNRFYDINKYIKIVEKIKYNRPCSFLSTDIIIGFPGEDKYTIKDTENIVRLCQFHHLHLFPFSKREGTIAYNMEETFSETEKSFFIERLYTIIKVNKQKFINSFIGKTDLFLIESISNKFLKGKTYHNLNICAENNKSLNLEKGHYLKTYIYGKKDFLLLGKI